jgi:uncharacterized membrane protein YkvA (DUF1232 family)
MRGRVSLPGIPHGQDASLHQGLAREAAKESLLPRHGKNFPHLVDQLEFLADCVEDVAEGAYKDLPYSALAAAVFALTYAHKKTDIIPDHVGPLGHADDSSVARAALILHGNALAAYAESVGLDFDQITSKP